MAPEIPPERILDRLTRLDELLALNLEAIRKLTKEIEKLAGIPPRVIAAPPAPALAPLAGGLDDLAARLDRLLKLIGEYRKSELQGKPVAIVGRYLGSDTAYKEVAAWRIGDFWGLPQGHIKEVSVFSSNFSKTRFRLTVMKRVLFKDLEISKVLTVSFPPHEIPFGEKVILECRSSDGTTITVDGSITGKEF